MNLRERIDTFLEKRQLVGQITRMERLETRAKESGKVTPTQMNFAEAQDGLSISPEVQEYWDEKAKEAFMDPSGEKLQAMLEQLTLADLTLLIRSWKQELQRRHDGQG